MSRLERAYSGERAAVYDTVRSGKPIWESEQSVLSPLILSSFKDGSTILDIAGGTGRWLDCYRQLNAKVILLDASADMLREAEAKFVANELPVQLVTDDAVFGAPFPRADYAISTRFLNWIAFRKVDRVLARVREAGIKKFVFSVRLVEGQASIVDRLKARRRKWKRNYQRFTGRREKGYYFIHSEKRLLQALDRHGLKIERRECMERLPGETYDAIVVTVTKVE